MRYLIYVILVLVACSCSKTYKITGTSSLVQAEGKTVILKQLSAGVWTVRDSAVIREGAFSMQGEADSAAMVSIFMDEEAVMPMVLEAGEMTMALTEEGITVQGTELNERLYAFIKRKAELDAELVEVSRVENRLILQGLSADEAQSEADKQAAAVTKRVQQLTKDFIATNYENVLGPAVFLIVCGSSFPYPYLTPDLEAIYRDAPPAFKHDAEVKEYVAQAQENMKLLHERYQERQADWEQMLQRSDTIDSEALELP